MTNKDYYYMWNVHSSSPSVIKHISGNLAIYVSIDQCAWTINIWHIIKQILTYHVGKYGIYGSSATILTSALPQSILLHEIHKITYCPHPRPIFVYYTAYIILINILYALICGNKRGCIDWIWWGLFQSLWL